MVLRLVIHGTVHYNGHSCLTSTFARYNFKIEKTNLITSWTKETSASCVKTKAQTKISFSILAAVQITVRVLALCNIFLS